MLDEMYTCTVTFSQSSSVEAKHLKLSLKIGSKKVSQVAWIFIEWQGNATMFYILRMSPVNFVHEKGLMQVKNGTTMNPMSNMSNAFMPRTSISWHCKRND